jgi:phosphoglycerate dehydrogenase-like enzyme
MASRPLRCLLTRKFWDQDLDYLRAHTHSPLEFIPSDGSVDAMVREAGAVDVLLGDVPPPAVLSAARTVKLMQIPWTGIDQVDMGSLRSVSYPVCNSHGNARAVAELGVALLLSLLKQVTVHDQSLRQGNWRRPGASDCIMPETLAGKRVVLMGFGAIGRYVGRMLAGFEVDVEAIVSERRLEGRMQLHGPEDLDHLCGHCDILIATLPLTDRTRGVLGTRQFALMKPTTYVVNMSRGATMDEEALYLALRERRIAGAALDVWYQYPRRGETGSAVSRFPFAELDNVVMSPHRGGMVRGELPHLADVAENLNHLMAGEPLINAVNIDKGY